MNKLGIWGIILPLIVISLSLVTLLVPLQTAYGAAVTFSFPTTPADGLLGSNICGGGKPCSPQVAVSGNDVYVIWQEFVNSPIKIRSSTNGGVDFGSETTLGTGNTKFINNGGNVVFAGTPDLVTSGNNVYAVWHDDGSIKFNEGTNFANAAIQLSGNTNTAITPQVATPGSDDVFVVWYDTTNNKISFKASNNKGLDFDTVNEIPVGNTAPLPAPTFPNPQITAAGNIVNVAWSSDVNILLSTSTNKGTSFGIKELQINDDVTNTASDPQIASLGNNVYVVWQQNNEIKFSRSTDNGETFSVPVSLGNGGSSASPQIAVAGNNVYVAWGGSTQFAFSNNNGQTFTTKQIGDTGPGLPDAPAIAAEGTNVVVVWRDKTLDAGGDIFAKVSSDSGVSFEAMATPAGDVGVPQTSIDPSVAFSGTKIFTAWQENGLPLFKIGTIGGSVIAFDQSQYKIGDTATITVTDPTIAGSVLISVDIISTSDPAGLNDVLFDENPPGSGIFEGSVTFVDGVSVPANGELHAETGPTGDVITASFGGNGATATIFPVEIKRLFMGGVVTGSSDYGSIANFEVTDPNANSDLGAEDSATIDITSSIQTISLPLKETEDNTGIFTEDITKNDDSLAQLIYMTGNNLILLSSDVALTQDYTQQCGFCNAGLVDIAQIKITSDSDNTGFTLDLTETDIDTRIFEGTFTPTEDPSAGTSIQVKLGDTVALENLSTSVGYLDNLFVTTDLNTNVIGSRAAIQVALFANGHDGDDLTASYRGAQIEWVVRDAIGQSGGGGGGGLVRPGLFVNPPPPNPDIDGDGVPNDSDNCPLIANPNQSDVDGDQVGDVCDNAPNDFNPDQEDVDFDGIGDVVDNCPTNFNPDQTDTDGDGLGNVCDVNPTLACGPDTILQGNLCAVDPAITQQITDLEALVEELENRIAELLALLNIFAPITEAECADIQATVDQRIADGKKVQPKLLSNLETCAELYG